MGDRSLSAGRALTSATVIVAALCLWGEPAGAEEMSGPELVSLAGRAVGDAAALERLRGVDRVDGRPVDLRRALDAPPREAAARARVLADGASTAPGPDETSAGRDARAILDEHRFQPRRAPRPFAGVLRRIGGWLRPVGEPVGRLAGRLDGTAAATLAALVVAVLAGAVAARLARRRTVANVGALASRRRGTRPDPEALERQADELERKGDLDSAFRLRFEAGLLRLDAAGRLRFRASLTTGEVLRQVPSAALGELAGTLEEIVYGGRPAQPPDLDAARSGWPRALQEAGP